MSETSQTDPLDITRLREAMSIPRRPLSRRALMKAAAIAPIIALGRQAWATPTSGIMAAFAKAVPVPPEQLAVVKAKAGAAFPGNDFDSAKFELVARVLWAHFHYGAGEVPVKEGVKLLEAMYDTLTTTDNKPTGTTLAAAVADGKFDPLGNDYQTNVCAYICGHKAALLALATADKKIDQAIYASARSATENEMKQKLALARNGSGPPLGFGC